MLTPDPVTLNVELNRISIGASCLRMVGFLAHHSCLCSLALTVRGCKAPVRAFVRTRVTSLAIMFGCVCCSRFFAHALASVLFGFEGIGQVVTTVIGHYFCPLTIKAIK